MKRLGVLAMMILQPVPLIGVGATAAVIGATHIWSRRAFAPWMTLDQRELTSASA